MRETHQAAAQLHLKASEMHSELGRLLKGLPSVIAALQALNLPTEQQAHQAAVTSHSQQLASTAAGIIDAVVPIAEAELGGQVVEHSNLGPQQSNIHLRSSATSLTFAPLGAMIQQPDILRIDAPLCCFAPLTMAASCSSD